jgi:hypothetical protein
MAELTGYECSALAEALRHVADYIKSRRGGTF